MTFSVSTVSADNSFTRLNIGSQDLSQSVEQTLVSDGLTHFQVTIDSHINQYVLVSHIMSKSDAERFVDKVTNIQESEPLIIEISDIQIKAVDLQSSNSNKQHIMTRVFLGDLKTKKNAKLLQQQLSKHQLKLNVVDSSELAYTSGNFQISILRVEPSIYKGAVKSILANNAIQNTTTVSKIAMRSKAEAAVNGGFFAYKNEQGIPGEPAGISVIDGNIVSESIINRPALLVQQASMPRFKILKDVSTKLTLIVDDKTLAIDGINRRAGFIFNCGYFKEGAVVKASHDVVCKNNDEIIIYDEHFGPVPPEILGDNFAFWIDESRGIYFKNVDSDLLTVPSNHYLVTASGYKKAILQEFIRGHSLALVLANLYESNEPIALESGMFLINGGPTLLVDGDYFEKSWSRQGWDPFLKTEGSESLDVRDRESSGAENDRRDRSEFYDNWVNRRHPRTAVGVTDNGVLFVVVIYGRNPKISAGASIHEMADVMRSLGVTNALNLDGGGSSIMVVEGEATGIPSDQNGERKVADALVFISENRE